MFSFDTSILPFFFSIYRYNFPSMYISTIILSSSRGILITVLILCGTLYFLNFFSSVLKIKLLFS